MNEDDIIQLAADSAYVTVEQLKHSRSRNDRIFQARCVCAYLLKRMGYKLQSIAAVIGYADHSGALYCIRTCETAEEEKPELYMKLRNAQDAFDNRMGSYLQQKKVIVK
jgi:chromosomal replication initiation ATPase DnaA